MAVPRHKPTGDANDETPHAPRLVIRASAGTGKTFQLSTRYIAQLAATTPDRILATTFTRKAAGEILERILLRLADAVLDGAARQTLVSSLNRQDLTRDGCLRMLTALAGQLHRVRVSTLDSFFSRVAGAFALELGLPAGWRLLDAVEDGELRTRAIETVLREGDRRDLVQLIHLLAKGDALRSVTGLVRDTVDDMYAVFLETPREAWRPIEGPAPLNSEALAAAIAALRAAPLPADKNWAKARDAEVQAAENGDWAAFIGKGIASKVLDGESTYSRKPIPDALHGVYRRLLQHAAAIECRVLSDQHAATRDLLERFDVVYRRLKHEAAGLTFDDVAWRLAEEFSVQHPAGLAYRLDSQLEHLLLDEFQDTSLVQWTVLEPLARSVAGGDGSTFFCVGDVKQAIYGWRGGVAEIFDTVTSRLDGLTETQLDASFRSATPVIETVNAVFRPRTGFPLMQDYEAAFLDWVNRFPRHTTHRRDEPGYAALIAGPEPGPRQDGKGAVFEGAAKFLAELFPKLPPLATVGVLARTNAAVGAMAHELRRQQLPASEEGGNPLVDAAAVQVVLSALNLADHPEHSIARFHVAHSPLGPLLDLPRDAPPYQVCEVSAEIRRQLQTYGYGGVVARWSDALLPHCNAREFDRLRQLIALADDYEPLATLRPTDFVRYVESSRIEDPRPSRIRVMTVHKAKGLEFDVVILPNLDDRLFQPPSFVACREQGAAAVRICRYRNKSIQRLLPREIQDAFRQTADRALREALSVFYVALTRAARALYMFVAPSERESQTYAGMLRQALVPGRPCPPGEVLYECGDPDWHRRLTPRAETAGETTADSVLCEPLRVPTIGARRRGRDSRAPSQLKSRRRLSIGDVLRPADSRALDRGRLLHAWFESIDWLADSPPDDDRLRRIALGRDLNAALVPEAAAEFRRLLTTPGIQSVLSRTAYARNVSGLFPPGVAGGGDFDLAVHRERRFDVLLDGTLVSGSIDRLVLLVRGGQVIAADVLDYKSDAIRGEPQSAVARLVESYAGQLDCYARAVAQIHGLPRSAIATRLVLLATQEVIPIQPPRP